MQVVKRAAEVQVTDVRVPMPMRPIRLCESRPFLGRRPATSIQASSVFENSIRRRRPHCDNVVVKHHECQTPITVQRMRIVVVEDRLTFPRLKLIIPRNLAVVLVGLAIAIAPVLVLARGQFKPSEQGLLAQLGAILPVLDVVDDLVADVVANAPGIGPTSS